MADLVKYWNILSKYFKSQWLQVFLLGCLFLLAIGLQLAIPQILRFFIDSALEGQALNLLFTIGGVFIGVSILQQIVALGVTYYSQNIGWNSTNALRQDLVSHCLSLDMGFHKKHRPGDIIERIDGDVTAMFNFLSSLFVEVAGHILLVVGVLVLLYLESIYIGLAMTGFVLLALYILRRIQRAAIPFHKASRERSTAHFGYLGEVLGSTEDIRSNGATSRIIGKFRNSLREWLPVQIKSSMVSMTMWTSTLLIFALGNAMAFGVGGVLWSRGIVSVGTVYLIFHYTEMLSMPLRQIQDQLTDLQKAGACVQRVEELLETKSAIEDANKHQLPQGALALSINGVSFAYERDLPALQDLSINLEAGKVLGVLGRTGSGKSTLARLITRFYDPSGGEIQLHGYPIKHISLRSLRSQVAFITQDVQLFNGTVRDNLTFFNPQIGDDRIRQALERGLMDWVNSLPHGLDTALDSDGAGLSAGEAQLLAFVRVFLKDPGLVILDEASSRLDPITEKLMEKAVSRLFKRRTGIIIAHRLQTIERADEVLILEKGSLMEHGDRLSLMANVNSQLSRLLQAGSGEVLS